MCLQDVKLGKAWEQKSANLAPVATGTILIRANAARRMIRFSYGADISILAGTGALIHYLGGSDPLVIGQLTSSKPFFDLTLQEHGTFVYGPFGTNLTSFAGENLHVFELLANTNEEDAIK